MESKEIISRLCKLQKEVHSHLGSDHSADCFCGEGGFWDVPGYEGTYEKGYRNDGACLEFIEQAVREKLKKENNTTPK
jgi:hypothetical protein